MKWKRKIIFELTNKIIIVILILLYLLCVNVLLNSHSYRMCTGYKIGTSGDEVTFYSNRSVYWSVNFRYFSVVKLEILKSCQSVQVTALIHDTRSDFMKTKSSRLNAPKNLWKHLQSNYSMLVGCPRALPTFAKLICSISPTTHKIFALKSWPKGNEANYLNTY